MTDDQRPPLSYEDPAFINSPDGRMLRILAEYMEPLSHFRRERIQDASGGAERGDSRLDARGSAGGPEHCR